MRYFSFALITCFFAFGTQTRAFVPEGGIGEPLASLFEDFEAICLPFIMHGAEVSRAADKAVYDGLIRARGYGHFAQDTPEYIMPADENGHKVERFDSFSKLGELSFMAKLYWHPSGALGSQFKPARRCEIRAVSPKIDRSVLMSLLQKSDPSWRHAKPPREFRSVFPPFRGDKDFMVFNHGELTRDQDIFLSRQAHYALCAADETGSIEVRLKVGRDWFSNSRGMDLDGDDVMLSVAHKDCEIPAKKGG